MSDQPDAAWFLGELLQQAIKVMRRMNEANEIALQRSEILLTQLRLHGISVNEEQIEQLLQQSRKTQALVTGACEFFAQAAKVAREPNGAAQLREMFNRTKG